MMDGAVYARLAADHFRRRHSQFRVAAGLVLIRGGCRSGSRSARPFPEAAARQRRLGESHLVPFGVQDGSRAQCSSDCHARPRLCGFARSCERFFAEFRSGHAG